MGHLRKSAHTARTMWNASYGWQLGCLSDAASASEHLLSEKAPRRRGVRIYEAFSSISVAIRRPTARLRAPRRSDRCEKGSGLLQVSWSAGVPRGQRAAVV